MIAKFCAFNISLFSYLLGVIFDSPHVYDSVIQFKDVAKPRMAIKCSEVLLLCLE